ncbi:MAG: GAF domain-containing protein [Nocardioidaceae bacterium]
MSDGRQQLVDVMNHVADALRSRPEADDTLTKISLTAREVIPGVDEVSISVSGPDGKIKTVAPTSELVCRPDELQYELDEGPCVDAIKFERTMRSEDLANDPQWPRYGPRAASLGFGCQMAVRIYDSHASHAALNLYSMNIGAFDESAHIAELFASHASVAMGFLSQRRNPQGCSRHP